MREIKKKNKRLILIILLLVISLGYALLNATLTINGNSKINAQSWDIHWNNVQVSGGSVAIGTNDQAATITAGDTTEVTYEVTLDRPGDFYEFTVDAVNGGTIDAMIDVITSTYKIGNGEPTTITANNLPDYLEYSVAYSDGTAISRYQELNANSTETYKARVAYKRDIDVDDLPETNQSIIFNFAVDYVQKDANGISIPHPFNGTTYTASTYDDVLIGQAIPNEITTYQTPAEAMASLINQYTNKNSPYFFKHTISNDIVTETYLGFVISDEMVSEAETEYIENCNNDQTCIDSYQGMTAGTYYLKAKKIEEYVNGNWQCMSQYDDGNGHCINPEYNTNQAILLNAFGSSNCNGSNCSVPSLQVWGYSDGTFYANDGEWVCGISSYGSSGCDND